MGLGLFCAKEKLKMNNSFRKIRFFISVMYTITPDESPVAGKEFQCPLGPRLFFPVRINQNKRSNSLRVYIGTNGQIDRRIAKFQYPHKCTGLGQYFCMLFHQRIKYFFGLLDGVSITNSKA